MFMKVADLISRETKQQINRIASSKKKHKKKKHKSREQLSIRDIENLMGMHMDTYERRRGALRRK